MSGGMGRVAPTEGPWNDVLGSLQVPICTGVRVGLAETFRRLGLLETYANGEVVSLAEISICISTLIRAVEYLPDDSIQLALAARKIDYLAKQEGDAKAKDAESQVNYGKISHPSYQPPTPRPPFALNTNHTGGTTHGLIPTVDLDQETQDKKSFNELWGKLVLR